MKQTPRNADYTKKYNRNLILRLLRKAQMSRSELARASGLTRASVSLIVDELLAQRIVEELEPAAAKRGRTPLPLTIRAGAFCAIGVYLNRTGCQIGVVDFNGSLLCKRELPQSSAGRLERVTACVREIMQIPETAGSDLLGIGVSAPGPLDSAGGKILNPPGFEAWHDVAVGAAFSKVCGRPVRLENNACTLARYYCEANGLRDALLMLVDSGVGSGVISGGKLLQSGDGFTSELGHTTIVFDGRPCSCGGRGCLETYAAIPNLLRGTRYDSWAKLVADARAGEPEAARIMEREAAYLSAGITNLTNIINVDTVILTGDVCCGFDLLKPAMRKKLEGTLLGRAGRPLALEALPVAGETQICAAATAVFQHFLNDPA